MTDTVARLRTTSVPVASAVSTVPSPFPPPFQPSPPEEKTRIPPYIHRCCGGAQRIAPAQARHMVSFTVSKNTAILPVTEHG